MEVEVYVELIDGDKVVLSDKEGTKFLWPKFKLHQDIKEGDVLFFSILKKEEYDIKKNDLAKDILNEVLNTEG